MKSERGQAVVLTAVMLAALLGLGAMVLDVGAWFRTKRQTQATADAAALAGAQVLLLKDGDPVGLAVQYAGQNGGGVSANDVTFESQWTTNDTIVVHAHVTHPSYFSKIFGVGDQTIGAIAKARSEAPADARFVAPIGVDRSHPLLSGSGCPCFNQATTLDLQKVGPGAFRILDIDGSRGGTSPKILGGWMTGGLDSYMGLGWYYSDSGAKFNSNDVTQALQDRLNSDLLFPVYDATQAQGSNFQYRVVGWVAFHLTGFSGNGNKGILDGYFKSITWDGIQAQTGSQDFGTHTIQLVQ
jgi:hypothetical protein